MLIILYLITVLSVFSCDQLKTLSGEFSLCKSPKSFQVYTRHVSILTFQDLNLTKNFVGRELTVLYRYMKIDSDPYIRGS